jgi:cyclophilin family peptidyl-prolyl cis-trans isomerase
MRSFLLIVFTLCTLALVSAQAARAGQATVKVEVEGRGDFTIRLATDRAPRTTAQILKLVKNGFYDGQRFHRVDKSPKPFLVQMGDPASKNGDLSGNGGSGAEIAYEETGLPNVAGAVGLGHPVDQPNKGDSQFYVLLDNASFLDGKYTVFGQVVSGMDVVKKIQKGDRVTRVSLVN